MKRLVLCCIAALHAESPGISPEMYVEWGQIKAAEANWIQRAQTRCPSRQLTQGPSGIPVCKELPKEPAK